jgi:hypothetical protein
MNLGNFKMPRDRVLSTKTFLISHLIILIAALAFFGGLYYFLYPEKFQNTLTEYNPVTKNSVSLFLEISTPEDDILVNDGSIVISGKTGPNTTIIILSLTNDTGLQSNDEGEFSKVFPLTEGANIIEITAFDLEGNSKTVVKSIYYSEEKI